MPGLGDLSPQGTVAIGVIVGLISTSIQSLGLTLQRKSHLLEDEKEFVDRKPAYKRPRWQLGMFMFVFSNIVGSTIQITTLPLPVLSTLQASGLVFNTVFATLLLKEPFTRFSAIGTVLTCAGAALIATFGAIGEPAHNLLQLIELLKEKSFILWMAGTLTIALLTILFAHVLKVYSSHKHIIQHWLKPERPNSPSMSGSNLLRRSFTVTLPRPMQLRLSRLRLVRGLSYALISGILSAHSLLMAKSAVELIVRTIVDHNNQFNRFQSWLILLALIFFALSQLYYLHLGLRLCSTSVLYPFVFCMYNVIAILDGLIYFQQASLLSGLDAGLVAVGTVILLAGVLALSWRLDDSTPQDPASQSIASQTPLTPGLGIMRGSQDLEQSPLLGSVRPSFSDERTPLLSRRQRARTLDLQSAMPQTSSRDIWAELDDDESGLDILASLPQTPSPFLTNRRSRRGSASSRALSSTSERSSEVSPGGLKVSKRQEKRLSPSPKGETRVSSAPQPSKRSSSRNSAKSEPANAEERPRSSDISRGRPRGHTVHFEEQTQDRNPEDQRGPVPSRWDASVGQQSRDRKGKRSTEGDTGDAV